MRQEADNGTPPTPDAPPHGSGAPASEPAAAPRESPGARIGRYRLVQEIGEGGFGVVWMAEQEEPLCRRVALKILKSGMDTREVIARFEAERQALAMMDHPNIAHVFDAGATEGGRPYFVMELVRGIPITRYCDEGRLSPQARLRLFVAVCHGVQHAHQKGVVHRDLKPSNILVALHDGVPVPTIIDFGIAKATSGMRLTDRTLTTQFHSFIGTPAYMSPEQIEMSGLDVDTRSDIYSLGVLLYELLAGRPPFDAEALAKSGLEAMRRTIRELDPPLPSRRLDTLPAAERATVACERGTDAARLQSLLCGDLDAIVMHCVEKDRARRYETANTLASDIERHLRHESISARPPGGLYRARKFVRRHRFGAAAAVAVALSLCAGLIASSILFVRERAAHREAEGAREAETIHASRTARDLAEQLLADDRTPEGLAWLVHAARKNPRDTSIGPRLASALTSRGFLIPTAPARQLPGAVLNVHYADQGRKIVAYGEDGTVDIIDTATGAHVRTRLPAGLAAPGVVIAGCVDVVRGKDDVVRVLHPTSGSMEREFNFGQKIFRLSGANPDAPILVIVLADESVVVAEAATGVVRAMPFQFSPQTIARLSPDGHWLAVFNPRDDAGRLWDLASGEGKALTDSGGTIIDVAFSPDGTRLLLARRPGPTGEQRFFFRLLSLPELQAVADLRLVPEPTPASAGVLLAFSPDGRVCSIAAPSGQQLYDAATGANIGAFLSTRVFSYGPMSAYHRWREGVSFPRSSGFGTLFFGSREQPRCVTLSGTEARPELTVRDALTSNPVLAPLVHAGGLATVRAIDAGSTLISRRRDGALLLWDLRRGEQRAEGGLREQQAFDLALAPDENELVFGNRDGTVQRIQVSRGPARSLVLPRTPPEMPAPFLSGPPARLLWLMSTRATAIDVASGNEAPGGFAFPEPIAGLSSGGRGISVRPDLRYLVVETVAGGWKSWELAEGRVVHAVALVDAPAETGRVCFGAAGNLVAIIPGDRGPRARVWHLDTGHAASEWLPSEVPLLTSSSPAGFSPDGALLALGDERGGVTVWDLATSQPIRHLKDPYNDAVPILDVRFSPDGTRIAAKDGGGGVVLWDPSSGRFVGRATVHGGPSTPGIAFSPSGGVLLTWGLDGVARTWDSRTGAPVSQPMVHRDAQIRSAAFTPDGRRVVTAANDGTARIWDARTGLPLTEPLRHRSLVHSCAFSSDGRFLCTGEAGALDHSAAFCLWAVPPDCGDAPAPEWLLQLATICAQKTINDAGLCVDAPEEIARIDTLRHTLAALPEDAPFAEWGRWVLDDRADRPIAPGFTITPAEADALAQRLENAPTTAP